MDTRHRDCTITLHNAVVLTEQPNSQIVGNSVAMFLFPIDPSFSKRKISYHIALHFSTRREHT
jgi:hypothetical protein